MDNRGEPIQYALSEWHSFVVGLLGALTTGFIYAYSTYANALQKQFGFTQSQKDTIGIAPVLCNLITFTNGLVMDCTSVWFCLLLGGLIMLCGYGLYGLVALKYIEVDQPEWIFFGIGFVGNYGASFIVAGTFTVLGKNFQDLRPDVISIAKSWVGVATGVGTAIYCGFVVSADDDPVRLNFLFFVAAITGFIPMLIAPLLRPLPAEKLMLQDNLLVPFEMRLPFGYVLSAVLIAITLISSFFKSNVGFSVVLSAILLVPFIMLVPSFSPKYSVQAQESSALVTVESAGPLSVGIADAAPPASQTGSSASPLVRGPGRRISSQSNALSMSPSPWRGGPALMTRRPEFVMLWLCILLLQSGGIFLTTNIASMVQSRSGAKVEAATGTVIFSCTQGFARLVTGKVSTLLLRRGLPRTWYFPFMLLVTAIGNFVLCLPGPIALCCGIALCAWAFGSTYPLTVLTVAEVFGQERLASNYMVFDGTPGAIGSLFFAKFLAQSVYEAHQGPVGQDPRCQGDECFRLSHAVMGISSSVGVLLGCYLAMRTRHVYEKILEPEPAIAPATS